MKHYLALAAMMLSFTFPAEAEEATLFSCGTTTFGGFGGPGVYYTQFKNDPCALVGGMGALLINHRFYLGGGGFGFTSRPHGPETQVNGIWHETHLEGGYGGGLIGVIIQHDRMIHAAADLMIGGGSIVRTLAEQDNDNTWNEHRPSDEFFFVQPMAHLEVNLTHWMRSDLGAGYRFVTGISKFDLHNEDVSGPVAGLTFRFGKF
jgi:hypothetical protein